MTARWRSWPGTRVNIADFFKETVAVVTNPAIDRGREVEVFSTSSLFGASPSIGQAPDPNDIMVTLKIPLLTGGHPALGSPEVAQALAGKVRHALHRSRFWRPSTGAPPGWRWACCRAKMCPPPWSAWRGRP